jgi:hypothetical protein
MTIQRLRGSWRRHSDRNPTSRRRQSEGWSDCRSWPCGVVVDTAHHAAPVVSSRKHALPFCVRALIVSPSPRLGHRYRASVDVTRGNASVKHHQVPILAVDVSGAGRVTSVPRLLRLGQRRTQLVLKIMQFVDGHAGVGRLVECRAGHSCVHGLRPRTRVGATRDVHSRNLQRNAGGNPSGDYKTDYGSEAPNRHPRCDRPGRRRDNRSSNGQRD